MADLVTLAQRCRDLQMAAEPVWATVLGDHRFDDRLPDVTAEAQADLASQLREVARQAEAIDPQTLSGSDTYTRAMLISEPLRIAAVLDVRMLEFNVTPISSGPQSQLLQTAPLATFAEPEHALSALDRYAQAPTFLRQAAQRLREGVAAGRTPPRVGIEQTIAQLDMHLAAPVEDDPLLSPTPPPEWAGEQRWRERLLDVVRDVVRPALADYRQMLNDEMLSVGRPPERSGVCWLPDGEQVYAACIREHVTVAIRPRAIHQMGKDAIASLDDEYRDIGSRVFGDIDRAGVFDRLMDDPALRYSSSEEIVADAREALARASAAVGQWFGRLPSTECAIQPQTPGEAAGGILAFYLPPAPDGSRPGTYKVNTSDPQNTTRFDAEALAFHEALPGHHLQIALAQELDLPEFRRQSITSAYTEGWGLYTERLAEEMGLYSDDVQRLGMLAADSLRSSRLVVDTGLHALGWSRNEAVEYLTANTPIPVAPATAEIDRYVSLPGQALSYKLGQHTIIRLRSEAEQALGDRFDIRGFHDTILAEGALSLDVLEQAVGNWIAAAG